MECLVFPHLILSIKESIEECHLPKEVVFDQVVCWRGINRIFEDYEKARKFFFNVSQRLKENGFFFGMIPDSSVIWSLANKQQKSKNSLPHVNSSHLQNQKLNECFLTPFFLSFRLIWSLPRFCSNRKNLPSLELLTSLKSLEKFPTVKTH